MSPSLPDAGFRAAASRETGAPPAGWDESARAGLRRLEYHFSPAEDASGEAFSAPNRAQGLRSRMGREGVSLRARSAAVDLSASADAWELVLRLSRLGREGSMAEVERVSPVARESRLEYPRAEVLEWYVNDERGLEQGFDVIARPAGDAGLALVLEMELGGGLGSRLSEDCQEVLFSKGAGIPVLRYGKLQVLDARGAEVEAELALEPGRLRIVIRDEGAPYPLHVDPLMTSAAWTAEGDQEGATFATSVATAGDVNGDGFSDVLVGAPEFDNGEIAEGRAYLYLGSAAGLAAAPAWTAESNQVGAGFGYSVAAAGDVNGDGFSDVIISARFFDNGESNEGGAFVYHGSAAGLALAPASTVESNQVGALFGQSVAGAGDVNGDGFSDVIIGSFQFDNGQSNEGGAFVYLGSAAGLSTTAAWTAESNQADAWFGLSVSTAGDVNGDGFADVIVGSFQFDNGESDEGGAFVYLGSATGLAAAAAWTAESNQADALFGFSVSTAGDVNGDGYSDVLVGAIRFDNGETDEGRAHLYLGSAAGLASTPAWTAESNQEGARFGLPVATAGDVNGDGFADVLVGALRFDAGETDEGRAFVYLGSAAGLSAAPAWTAESNQPGAIFGSSAATAGDVNGDGFSDVLVGAQEFDNGETDEGRAFAYLGAPGGLAAAAAWTAESDQAGAGFGYSVATAGDVNGDGYSDVIVGASGEGRAFVYHGSASGLAAAPAWTAESNQANALFGWSVSTAGDVNGDGFSDVIVGAYEFDAGETDEGRAFVYHGSASGLAAAAAWTAESNQANAWFGRSVSTAGDVNGDGFSDVIVGALFFDNGHTDEGGAFVYHGSASGLAAAPAWTAESNQVSANFGFSVSTAGDVNGDGFSDVIVGAWLFSAGESQEGRAFVYHGSASGLAAAAAWTAESNQTGAVFGWSVSTAGDVNGDGFSDVIVGASFFNNGETDEGRAFVYHGSASGLAAAAAWTAESNQANARFGSSVATAGDVNGDGFSDVIVGAFRFDAGETDEGRAFVYHGSASGLAAAPAWTAESNQEEAEFGISVSTAGDVNGDGFSDVIVGAVVFDAGETNEGRAFVYHGNSGGGLERIPRQARADGSAPIDLLGTSDSPTSFRLRARGRSPEGRGLVALEWEVKPLGIAFDGTGLGASAAYLDSGSPVALSGSAAALEELVSGLAPGTPQHWRLRIATANPFFPRSPWLSLPGNSRTETDFRTAPNEAPVALCQDVTRAAGASCQAAVSAAEVDRGSLDPDGVDVTLALSPPGPYGLGDTTVTLTVTDTDGASASCTATVTVEDTTPPVITCPAAATLAANGGCAYTGAIPRATATDDCSATAAITISSDAPASFPLGTTVVMWTAADEAGETSTCTSTVTVLDRAPPEITCPVGITVECTAPDGAAVAFQLDARDDCGGQVTVEPTPASGSTFAVGTTQVSVTATDAAGNMASCGFEVTVTCVPRGGLQVPGDCNQDGMVDLSDAVCLLGFLFLGRPRSLPCSDGSPETNLPLLDWNNDRSIDLSDAVATLSWLFAGARGHFLGESCQRLLGCEDACQPGN